MSRKSAQKAEPVQIEMSEAAAKLRAMVNSKVVDMERTKRLYRCSKRRIEKLRADMETRAQSGEWANADPAVLVALYEWLHRSVYGVDPEELNGRAWAFASTAAKRMVAKDFAGDVADAVEFMKWTWKRELKNEEWRRANGRDTRRVGWRLQFVGGYLLTDYRMAKAREQ